MGRTLGSNVEWPTDYGFKVCSKAFCSAYGINKSFFYKYMAKYKDGAISAGSVGLNYQVPLTAKQWTGCKNTPGVMVTGCHIQKTYYCPIKLGSKMFWKKYSEEMAEEMEPQLCRSTFQTMWKKHFVHLKIKKVTNTLAISFLGVLLVTTHLLD